MARTLSPATGTEPQPVLPGIDGPSPVLLVPATEGTAMSELKVIKTPDEWRTQLSDLEYHVLREAGTERPWTGEYTTSETQGIYRCKACGAELFRSTTKFDSHCGWPSFFSPLAEDRVRHIEDTTLGMKRVEVRCAACDSHLGHVFSGEGYDTPTDLRYCINSVCLVLDPDSSQA